MARLAYEPGWVPVDLPQLVGRRQRIDVVRQVQGGLVPLRKQLGRDLLPQIHDLVDVLLQSRLTVLGGRRRQHRHQIHPQTSLAEVLRVHPLQEVRPWHLGYDLFLHLHQFRVHAAPVP